MLILSSSEQWFVDWSFYAWMFYVAIGGNLSIFLVKPSAFVWVYKWGSLAFLLPCFWMYNFGDWDIPTVVQQKLPVIVSDADGVSCVTLMNGSLTLDIAVKADLDAMHKVSSIMVGTPTKEKFPLSPHLGVLRWSIEPAYQVQKVTNERVTTMQTGERIFSADVEVAWHVSIKQGFCLITRTLEKKGQTIVTITKQLVRDSDSTPNNHQ